MNGPTSPCAVRYAPREVVYLLGNLRFQTQKHQGSTDKLQRKCFLKTYFKMAFSYISHENIEPLGGKENILCHRIVVLDCGERRAIERGGIYKVKKNENTVGSKAFQRPKRK